MKKVEKFGQSEKELLLSKSPYILPDNPSTKNFSASQIRRTMYEPFLVLLDYLNRVIDEFNTMIDPVGQDEDESVVQAILRLQSYFTNGIADKATADKNGNDIASTYETIENVTAYLATKQNNLSFDNTPTSGSSNPVKSGGIHTELEKKELKSNKVTELTDTSTDTQYPSAKVVFDELKSVREVAEGKCKTFVISYSDTISSAKSAITLDSNLKFMVYNSESEEWEDKSTELLADEYDEITLINSSFNSSNTSVAFASSEYILTRVRGGYSLLFADFLNKGDNILVIETDVPDRWWDESGVFYKLEIGKIDLTPYPTFTNLNSILGGIMCGVYDDSATYALNDIVIHDNKLYKCTTAIATAEEWTNGHWTQVLAKDYFVDLTSAQTITGKKTHTNDIELNQSSEINSPYVKFVNQYSTGSIRLNAYNFNIDKSFLPNYNFNLNLGASTTGFHWKEGFIDKITDDNGSYSSDNVFNVINASDIVSNTLTQAQYDLITNGKPTLIKGTLFSSYENALFLSPKSDGTYQTGFVIGQNGTNPSIQAYSVAISTKVISLYTINKIDFQNVRQFNGKSIPPYPTNPTSRKALIYGTDNALSYDDPIKTTQIGSATVLRKSSSSFPLSIYGCGVHFYLGQGDTGASAKAKLLASKMITFTMNGSFITTPLAQSGDTLSVGNFAYNDNGDSMLVRIRFSFQEYAPVSPNPNTTLPSEYYLAVKFDDNFKEAMTFTSNPYGALYIIE